jgi:hypothetical protein
MCGTSSRPDFSRDLHLFRYFNVHKISKVVFEAGSEEKVMPFAMPKGITFIKAKIKLTYIISLRDKQACAIKIP